MVKRKVWTSLAALLILSYALTARAGQANSVTGQGSVRSGKSARRGIRIASTVGTDGKTLIDVRDHRLWYVANPLALRSVEGRRVTVKAVLASASSEINVLSITVEPEVTSASRLGDSAFRR